MNYSVQQVHDLHLKAAKQFIVNLRDDEKASKYIESRGLNLAWAIDNGLGYALPKWGSFVDSLSAEERRIAKACGLVAFSEKTERHFDSFRDRIMFPILNNDGYIVGMGGRDISGEDDTAKYINTKETAWFKKHDVLYNLHRCHSLGEREIVVVEGYMDVVAARHAGVNNLTAVMGTAFTEHHAQACIDKGIAAVTFCYDGDKAGLGAASRSLPSAGILKQSGIDVSFVFLPEGTDPDDVIRNEGVDSLKARISNGNSPESFIANHHLDLIGGSTSLDMNLKAVNDAVNSAIENQLDASAVWDVLSEKLPENALTLCTGYAEKLIPGLVSRTENHNSHSNSDISDFQKRPM